jgi:two-component system cell cycle response regulator
MADTDAFDRTPLALIIDDDHRTEAALSKLLRGAGYAVLNAWTGRRGIEVLLRVQPDLLLVGSDLPDLSGPEILRRLGRSPHVRRSTPILLVSGRPLEEARRVEAFQAGAWDILTPPFETSELLPRLRSLVAAKQDADHAREEGLLDPTTGFYNVRGVLRRLGELTADAARYQRPVACVVIGADPAALGEVETEAKNRLLDTLSLTLTGTTRLSDTVGRLGGSDFVVVAAGTDPEGASRLAERLLSGLEAGLAEGENLPVVRAGYYAVVDASGGPVLPADLVTRATLALRRAQDQASDERIFRDAPA